MSSSLGYDRGKSRSNRPTKHPGHANKLASHASRAQVPNSTEETSQASPLPQTLHALGLLNQSTRFLGGSPMLAFTDRNTVPCPAAAAVKDAC
jgi:hypothetical protein